jgi:hypothetical protein
MTSPGRKQAERSALSGSEGTASCCRMTALNLPLSDMSLHASISTEENLGETRVALQSTSSSTCGTRESSALLFSKVRRDGGEVACSIDEASREREWMPSCSCHQGIGPCDPWSTISPGHAALTSLFVIPQRQEGGEEREAGGRERLGVCGAKPSEARLEKAQGPSCHKARGVACCRQRRSTAFGRAP